MLRKMEALLAEWHQLYKELNAVRARLAGAEGSGHFERAGLEADAARLKQQIDAALHAVQASMDKPNAARTSQGDRPPEGRPAPDQDKAGRR